jgi:hypothetical protein
MVTYDRSVIQAKQICNWPRGIALGGLGLAKLQGVDVAVTSAAHFGLYCCGNLRDGDSNAFYSS